MRVYLLLFNDFTKGIYFFKIIKKFLLILFFVAEFPKMF
ncbi:hypothetical protein FEDK69T_11400 [Flavobacterium enshiense DK69]|nr:hypothetical protein FEDK69T_11400 [Flavobacterium enshiense DK69]